ncbi:hypothetical protein DHL47_05610 [Streptococcus panodentis]|uniref:Uncharacterized protein n=1 Tax=Streptococcus panodentis TaxID=1581472 RepID=A0ABS5AW74_9STRE|nr:hypothetical protein [Streptococcus panodentis]
MLVTNGLIFDIIEKVKAQLARPAEFVLGLLFIVWGLLKVRLFENLFKPRQLLPRNGEAGNVRGSFLV